MTRSLRLATLLALALAASPLRAEQPFVTLASTTSTRDSGLYDDLLPKFTRAAGIEVRVVAVGSGQAIELGRRGDADLLVVHDPELEERFVADGFGVERRSLMDNDFVIVGPKADPAGVRGRRDAPAALAKIAAAKAPFASRADSSGTHQKERRLWKDAGIDPTQFSGAWYRETGSGMGATLNTAAGMGAYALADRATWDAFGNKGDLELLVEGDARLDNPYSVILVNPAKHPHVKADLARRLADWLVSSEGQAAIAAFERNGHALFRPTASAAAMR
jgi:tungstate transport system substrate-binding protein